MPIRPRKNRRKQPDAPAEPADLATEIAALRHEVARLNRHSFVRIHNSSWRLLGHQFLKGLVLGLGTVLGASILVSIVAYFLSQIELIPIIGEWASEILRQIQDQQQR